MGYSKDMLRNKMIASYLSAQAPISSQALKKMQNLDISSSTIRNHFRAMTNNGILTQAHGSSGRVPTNLAMKNYWLEKIKADLILKVDSKNVQNAAKQSNIFTLIVVNEDLRLASISAHGEYLLAIFESTHKDEGAHENKTPKRAVVLPYNQKLMRFLGDLIGLGIDDVRSAAKQLMAKSLLLALKNIEPEGVIHGVESLAFLLANQAYHKLFFDCINKSALSSIPNGLIFHPKISEGYMALASDIMFYDTPRNAKPARMLCIGSLFCDFNNFLSQLKGDL